MVDIGDVEIQSGRALLQLPRCKPSSLMKFETLALGWEEGEGLPVRVLNFDVAESSAA